jgi:hypothetical protein
MRDTAVSFIESVRLANVRGASRRCRACSRWTRGLNRFHFWTGVRLSAGARCAMQKYNQYCSTEILGDRWTLLIVREMILGSHRFNEIERRIVPSAHCSRK